MKSPFASFPKLAKVSILSKHDDQRDEDLSLAPREGESFGPRRGCQCRGVIRGAEGELARWASPTAFLQRADTPFRPFPGTSEQHIGRKGKFACSE